MYRHEAHVGQDVSFAWKGTKFYGTITKCNPKKAKVATHTPSTHPCVNVPYSLLTDRTGSSTAPSTPLPSAPEVRHTLGAVVKAPAIERDTLFVVVGHHGEGHRIAKLGGDGGRYYTGIAGSVLESVNFELAGV